MKKVLSWLRNGEILLLSGKLNQDVLNPLWEIRYEIMQNIRRIDLSGITKIDTAGVALLIHLIDIGKSQNLNIILSGVNENISTLAQLYNLTKEIFPY